MLCYGLRAIAALCSKRTNNLADFCPPVNHHKPMTRRYFRPLKPQTVIDTLHFVRQEMVRDEREGVGHVDYLLRMYGAEPLTLNIPRKTPKLFAKGELRKLVLEALRSGPKTGRQIADYVEAARPGLPDGHAYKRVYICLWELKKRKMVRNSQGSWQLAPQQKVTQ